MLRYTLLVYYIKLSGTDIATTDAEEPVVK